MAAKVSTDPVFVASKGVNWQGRPIQKEVCRAQAILDPVPSRPLESSDWGVKVGRLGLCTWQRNEQWYPRRRESIPVITSEKRDVTKSFALTFATDLPPRNFPSFFSFGVEDDGNISRNYSGTGKWVTTHTALVYGELFAKAIRHKERGGHSIVLHLTEAGWKVNGTRALYTRQSCMVALSRPTYKES